MTHREKMPPIGIAEQLRPGLQRMLAPNASPMTYWGTNTYILGENDVVVIDPGPDDPAHLNALLQALDGRRVAHILVTHSHLDHSGLCMALAKQTGVPIAGFGDSEAGRSDIMTALVAAGMTQGGEGVDKGFRPDAYLADGAKINGPWGEITAIHTPGHMANHLCFAWGDDIFTGDHIMGWSTSLISPPDGDLTAFMQSCRKLQDIPAVRYFPGHGAAVSQPEERLAWLMTHRQDREAQILSALRQGAAKIPSLTESIYRDLSPGLLPAAQRNVFAHLIDLCQRHVVFATPNIGFDAKFQINDAAELPVTGM
ncbi:MBL fold metallo-hydrolase [Loktanella sp. D2R18]|uniref:MBL fold metallo-hydrolase n=1 Tax=Rhodobacterales TaxID=204455 RepID=UPI000DE825C4|nr:MULTISPECIES: MBL fold metallo-hydrolase [Rhodobacterales]MDO6591616.1 MBL fold metallo-hydrolase [Yoonia sp. 1_MG-2023]RBW43732.1 MBL fold metallo-hydrolase [Loktanella sp. D2R18]